MASYADLSQMFRNFMRRTKEMANEEMWLFSMGNAVKQRDETMVCQGNSPN